MCYTRVRRAKKQEYGQWNISESDQREQAACAVALESGQMFALADGTPDDMAWERWLRGLKQQHTGAKHEADT